jgi:camphor 5-monooxygenase
VQAAVARPEHVPAARVVDVDIYAVPGMSDDYQRAWADLQSITDDLVWTPRNEGHWIAMRGDVLAEVQSDHERFSSRIIIIPKSIGEMHGMIPTTIDPPQHRPYRVLLNATFAPAAVRRMSDNVHRVAAELIESFRGDGYCDFTNSFARVFPIRLFMAIVNLPMADAPKIQLWAESMTRPAPVMPFDVAKQAFYDYLAPIIAERRVKPGDDLISHIITADMDGRTLDQEEALSLATQILIAGVDTVVNFLGFAMLFLARNPEARRELATHPSAIPQATHELFRRFGLVTIARTVREDMDYRGVRLKAGELIAIPTAIHGLDDRLNDDPLRVDFSRKRARHSAFGSGPHMCPGQELARAEVAITIEEWLKRIPEFEVAEDADTGCGGGIVGSINRLCLKWETE